MNNELQQKLDAVIDECVAARISLGEAGDAFKRRYIQRAVDLCGGNQCRAAKRINAHRNTVARYKPQVTKSLRRPMGNISLSPRYTPNFSQG